MRLATLGLLLATLSGCYASSPLTPEERGAVVAAPPPAWRAPKADDLPGLWASRSIQGTSAGVVLKAYYALDGDGGYSGSALVLSEGRPRFVLLADDGLWTLDGARLDLHDGAPPLIASVADDRLRLVAGDDVIELERVPLD